MLLHSSAFDAAARGGCRHSRGNVLSPLRMLDKNIFGFRPHSGYELFPRLLERQDQLSRTLSGGEQQMLVVGRALLTNPSLLILDEATEGLAPIIREQIWRCLATLKAEGETILVIDKNLKEMARVVDRHHIIEKGRQVWDGTPVELAAQPELSQRYLGV